MSTGIPRPRTASLSLHISTSSHGLGMSMIPASTTSSPGNLGRVPLDARVVLSKRRTGYVRYIGKLAGEAGEWYGVALDEAKGEHDGRVDGISYFTCAPLHGVFVRRKEIFYMKEQPQYVKNPPSPVMNDTTSDEGDAQTANGSSDSGASVDSHELAAHGATSSPRGAGSTSALQRTFKSFHRVLQTPAKLGQSLINGAMGTNATTSPVKSPSRRTTTRASMIPPPAITSPPTAKQHASRHQSIAFHPHHELNSGLPKPQALTTHQADSVETRIPSILDEDHEFAAMTRALAEQNNHAAVVTEETTTSPPPPPTLPLPPQIDPQESGRNSHETSPASSPHRRSSVDRRHSTFAFGTTSVSSAAASAAANAVRVVELEKEIVTMRTNHENVVAVLRATNKQHAANVLELRAQVSALADGNMYLQRQLSLKSAQLHELRQAERDSDFDRSELQSQLEERDAKIRQFEEEITTLQTRLQSTANEKESVLLHMQREFQARQQRDREQIKRLREDVVSLCNARNALQSELHEAKEMSFLV